MIYKCKNCDHFFAEEDAEEKEVCLEDMYGVGGQFGSSTYQTILVCPGCGSEELEEVEDCEVCAELELWRFEYRRLKKETNK